MFLWSNHDVFLEHKRRYTLKQLEQLVLASGLQLTRSSYYYGLLFPIVSLLRIAKNKFKTSKLAQSELAQHNPLTNWTLSKICLLELRFMRLNKLAGLTAFCLAVKKWSHKYKGLAIFIFRTASWKATIQHLATYFLFLSAVPFLSSQGSHYLYATSAVLSLAIYSLTLNNKSDRFSKTFGGIAIALLLINSASFQ